MSRFFSILIFLIFLSFESIMAAQSNIYIVENIQTKATSKTALAARNLALQNARRDGLAILLLRLNVPISIMPNLTNEDISDMARSEQIIDEKIYGKSYSATLNIVYSKSFVEHFLSKIGYQKDPQKTSFFQIKSASTNSDGAVIIPILKRGKKNLIWEDDNTWRYFLKIAAKKNSNPRFIVPEGKLEDVNDVNVQNIEGLGFRDLENIISRNQAQMAYLLSFDYDEAIKKATVDVVSLKEFQKRSFRLAFYNRENLDQDSLKRAVAAKTIAYLSGKEDEISVFKKSDYEFLDYLPSTDKNPQKTSNEIMINVKINRIDDLVRLKKVIENSNLAENLNFLTISRDSTLISVSYTGSSEIASAFTPYGLQLYLDQNNQYVGNLL